MSDTGATTKDGQTETQSTANPPARPASEALRQTASPSTAAPPPPPRRSRASRNQIVVFMNFIMSAVVLMVIAAGAAAYLGKRAFESPGPAVASRTFLIEPNTGVSTIAAKLEREGIISSARIFQIGVRINGFQQSLKAGEYEIPAGASMRDVADVLRSGKSIQHAVTIPEGLTVMQALRRIGDEEALTGDLPSPLPPEGSIAADTLNFTRGATRKDIVAKLTAQQRALVDAAWANRAQDLPLADVNEFVTLASIVEKETGLNDERSRVASVFVNRLRKNMRLQSDPTIIYGLFQGAGKPADRPIYQSDIAKKTPYNTYVINGLPPTPIAIPGKAALEAVANPAQTDDLYFVADGTGGHVFAKTLEEHNRNVARYRELLKQQDEDAKASTDAPATDSPSIQPLP